MKKKLLVILGIAAAMDLVDVLAKGQMLGSLDMFKTDEPVKTFRTYSGHMLRGKMILKVAEFWKHFVQNM